VHKPLKNKSQHYVPSSYLQAWCDPKCPQGHAPYVWLTPVNGGPAKKKSPKKILRERDMYTIVGANGERDLSIERGLSQLEGKFARIRRNKLDKCLPLDIHEAAFVCIFVAAMHARTRTYREHLRLTWGRALGLMNKVEAAYETASPEQRERLNSALRPVGGPIDKQATMSKDEVAELVANPLQNWLPPIVKAIAPHLIEIPSVVMVAPKGCSFITSDTPCAWFDKGAYETPPARYAGGLISPTLEITMPLSPRQMLVFANRLRFSGYWSRLSRGDVESLNRRTFTRAEEFVVRNSRHTYTKPS